MRNDVLYLFPSGSAVDNTLSPKRRGGRGQRSVTRPMIGTYDTSDVAILVSTVFILSVIVQATSAL